MSYRYLVEQDGESFRLEPIDDAPKIDLVFDSNLAATQHAADNLFTVYTPFAGAYLVGDYPNNCIYVVTDYR